MSETIHIGPPVTSQRGRSCDVARHWQDRHLSSGARRRTALREDRKAAACSSGFARRVRSSARELGLTRLEWRDRIPCRDSSVIPEVQPSGLLTPERFVHGTSSVAALGLQNVSVHIGGHPD